MESLNYDLGRQEFGSLENAGKLPSREEVMELLGQWIENDRLLLHMKQLGALLGAWARKKGLGEQEAWKWEAAGLLHDADWEKWPDTHCSKIVEYCEEKGWDPQLIHAIASHGPRHFGVEPVNELDHMIYSLDELSGFVHAVSLMRPEGYEGMSVKSVKKKMKQKSFAAQVSREDIQDGAQRSGVPLEDLIQFVIDHQADVE